MNSPRKACQYGNNCLRNNKTHFKDYSHPYLEEILRKGKTKKYKYDIPEENLLSEDIILEQLEIIDDLVKSSEIILDCSSLKLSKNEENPSRENSSKEIKIKEEPKEEIIPPKTKEPEESKPTDNLPTTSIKVENDQIDDNQDKSNTNLTKEIKQEILDDVPGPSTSSKQIIPGVRLGLRNPQTEQAEAPMFIPPFDNRIYEFIDVVLPRGRAAKKLEAAAPYNFFLTTITSSPQTHLEPLSITFQELLDPSLGTLESSVQINFVVDTNWLLRHYYFAGHGDKPLLILNGDKQGIQVIGTATEINVHMEGKYATHHTKMMLFGYKDQSMRVVVSTANLYEGDWHNYTQGLWISPKCPAMEKGANSEAGESPTGFRGDLVRYLRTYNIFQLNEWISRIENSNFEQVNVFFVASSPGNHKTVQTGPPFGHLKLGHLLYRHCAPMEDTCPIIAQSSAIGMLGKSVHDWVLGDIGISMKKDSGPSMLKRIPPFKMIFPTDINVRNSHDGSAGCLIYDASRHSQQLWLEKHLHIWKSDKRHRSRAIPHIKSYFRYSEKEGLYWFCLTSANFSRAAWGSVNKSAKLEQTIKIQNYDAGVLFLPKFVTGTNTFPLKEGGPVPPFPMPYDLPLVPYAPNDKPPYC